MYSSQTNVLLQRLKITQPIFQAPMAGGATTPELVAAVSNAGGLGALGAGYMSGEQIVSACAEIRSLTNKPFAVNLFSPDGMEINVDTEVAEYVLGSLAPHHRNLAIAKPILPEKFAPDFRQQIEAVISVAPALFSFAFGYVEKAFLQRLTDQGCLVFGTATCLSEAKLLADYGVDGVVVQSAEAGGHRGSFAVDFEDGMQPLAKLLPQVVAAVNLPVVASGGIMTGQDIKTVLAQGASVAQLGTAFLACPESGAAASYKQKLLATEADTTVITKAFSGRPARGLANKFTQLMANERVLPYPVHNALTGPMRAAAKSSGNVEYQSLWAGQNVAKIRALPVDILMKTLLDEMT